MKDEAVFSPDSIRKIGAWIPVSDEAIVDFAIGTREQQRAAAARIAVRDREARAAWYALPLRIRWSRLAKARWSDFRYRLGRAIRAHRGEDE